MKPRVPTVEDFKDPFAAMLGAKETGLDRQLAFQKKFRLFEANPEDTQLGEMIAEVVLDAKRRQLVEQNPLLKTTPINMTTFPGTILLGVTQPHKVPYFITPDQLTRHCLVCGITGGTKTNLILLILCQLLKVHHDNHI